MVNNDSHTCKNFQSLLFCMFVVSCRDKASLVSQWQNLLASAEDLGLIADPGRSHMPWGYQACALQRCCIEPVFQSSEATTTEARLPWSPCSATPEVTSETRALQPESSLHPPQPKKSLHSNEDPEQSKIINK